MYALFYLYRRSFRNRMKTALKKPITYFYLVILLFYVTAVPYSFRAMFREWHMDSPEGMTAVFTLFSFWVIPGNLIAYARRKGLIYRHSDIHFLFPAPVGPKLILLYAHARNLIMTVLLNLILAVLCIYIFRVDGWRMTLYFLFSLGVENLLEAGIMILMYGSERMDDRSRGLVVKAAYALIGVPVLLGVLAYLRNGLSFDTVLAYLNSDYVQMVPLVGWYIAVLHLLFLGPSPVNVVCSILYFLLVAAVTTASVRMRCTGEYFEDAEKFADDYEEVLASRRQGRADVRLGKKRKLSKASVAYHGRGAAAIFYRQLLEYKKNRFFIFDMNTLVSLGAGIGIAWLYHSEGGFGSFNDFIVPAAMAYLIFIFSAYKGKWGKEMLSPYTFLIPDNPFRKLIFATAMQHIQALVNGVIFVLPPALVMRMPLSTTVLSVLGYVMLSACKLYILTVTEVAVGDVLGNVGKQFFQLLVQGLVILAAVFAAVLGFMLGGINPAYGLMILILAGAVAILITISTLCFYRMETVK